MKSDVYLVRCDLKDQAKRSAALKKLLAATENSLSYSKDEIVPVKITVGDSPCVYNVSPLHVKAVIDQIRSSGAKPFLFDTCVIYKGSRQNAVDHMNLVQKKGMGQDAVGAPFIVADGVFGQDGKEYDVGSQDIRKIRIPSFIGMLDSLVVITHVTGHIVSRYAGAVKNVAMGMSCRATKQVQHSSLKPRVITAKCTGCGLCVRICPASAIKLKDKKSSIDQDVCVGCGECLCACKFDAIMVNWEEDARTFSRRMADVAQLVLARFKRRWFINFAFDVTTECDCISTKGEAMASGNIGILASADPVAVDKASLDLALAKRSDYFAANSEVYEAMFSRSVENGLGNTDYRLIEI